MCGRYASSVPLGVLAERFAVDEVRTDGLPANYNVAPTDPVYAVAEHSHRRHLGVFRWGLDQPGGRVRPINARAETLALRPAFRDAFRRRRCLVPADGFYEWCPAPEGPKQPYYIRPRHGEGLAFAGIWAPGGTCAIVTTSANATMAPIHDRMPVILSPSTWGPWLDRDFRRDFDSGAELQQLLVPAADDLLEARAVSSLVNRVANNGPDLLNPVVP